METVSYSQQPEAIQYMPLPDGSADVWLRRNITQVDGEDAWGWEAEETYIHTDLTRDEVAANFDALFNGTYDPEADNTLEDIRADKIAEMSQTCEDKITAGVDVTLSDGESHHYSLTVEDQLNLVSLSAMLTAGQEAVPYHADGEECRYYTAEDFAAIVAMATTWKMYHEAYFNSLKAYISALEDTAEIRAIAYGCAIPAEYQSEVYQTLAAQMGATE
ncbi:MAG: hypothetical protein LUG44_03840 [Clostridiales bacterium]|nr:hypothetical protein [Clostridiales bacterium]